MEEGAGFAGGSGALSGAWLLWLAISTAAAAVLGADRLWSAWRRVRRIPGEARADNLARARLLVDDDERERRYARLAEKADLILAELVPNGGASIRDALDRIEGKLDAHLTEAAPLIAEHHEVKRALDAHLSLHLDGPAQRANPP